MHRWTMRAALLALLLTASGARAAEPGQPFQKVAPSHWAYASVRHLEEAGYFTGSPEGTFDGRQPRTRYEFAVAAERLYRSFQPRALSATDPGALRADLVLLRRLTLGEFAPEISGLGLDLTEIRRQLDALDQRLDRLERAARPRGGSPRRAPSPPPGSLGTFGLQTRLQGTLFSDLNASAMTIRPGVAASLGPVRAAVQVDGPDPLASIPHLPLEDPAAARSVRAELSLPVAGYLVSAYYSRLAGPWDRYGLLAPEFSGAPTEGVGAVFSGSLSQRVGFRFQGASFHSLAENDRDRLLYFSGVFNYSFGSGYLGAGYERTRQFGLSGIPGDASALFMNVGRNFGPNTRLEFRYRDGGAGNTSATTQISVKF